jgi:hypothetical protein
MESHSENPHSRSQYPPLSERFGEPATFSSDESDLEIRALLSSSSESDGESGYHNFMLYKVPNG